MEKLTYKDLKINQTLICVKQNATNYIGGEKDNERLILGERYEITDVDYHYHDRVCVKLKGPYYFHEEFVPIECFDTISYIRDQKLESIGI